MKAFRTRGVSQAFLPGGVILDEEQMMDGPGHDAELGDEQGLITASEDFEPDGK
ncbi:hypothetical protein [Pyxidicoccus sp. MSG2]|uniref:hypothetical protein n=1 Tax=Pyxidicoccus sp. MSG2 TaxID=2996790 RepID=UPI0022709358|nr:hypothetical protein [Pyxidicoccus sp. MSG2]MCY1018914.1 hypothetical protein [Pyxidicoccus sp. MSG2]